MKIKNFHEIFKYFKVKYFIVHPYSHTMIGTVTVFIRFIHHILSRILL